MESKLMPHCCNQIGEGGLRSPPAPHGAAPPARIVLHTGN